MIDSSIGQEHKNLMEINNHKLMLTKLFHSQGSYEGFFNYNGQQVSEKFTLILKKKPNQNLWDIGVDKASSKLTLLGFGQNNVMGFFLLEGYCEVVTVQEMVEKEGLKVEFQNQNEPMFMKLKIAKFVLRKRYQQLSLVELVEQKKQYHQVIFHRQLREQQMQRERESHLQQQMYQ